MGGPTTTFTTGPIIITGVALLAGLIFFLAFLFSGRRKDN